jgi:hypothetical protein
MFWFFIDKRASRALGCELTDRGAVAIEAVDLFIIHDLGVNHD